MYLKKHETVLAPKTMKVLASTKSKIYNDKNGDNVPHLEITDVILVHCNVVNNHCQEDSRVLYSLFLINHLVNY